MIESGAQEGSRAALAPRFKAGLETPLEGRFGKEGKRLVFAPPLWYDVLVFALFFGGILLVALSFLSVLYAPNPMYGMFLGGMLGFAGLWGALSNERMTCNLTTRTYTRLEGQGLRKRLVQGRLEELDALVLVTEDYSLPLSMGRTVRYRLVLHWKGNQHPLLIVEREAHTLPAGAPINASAGPLLQKGQRYAQALGVRYFDNSHFASPCPLPFA
ncbi:MAG: hypothetical protein HZC36_12760 [Armatimonadetes bacterium]|nr:hypothetical protein [Armatimonadota bacterium]